MPEGEAGPRPVQAPGLGVVAQTAFVIRTFTLHLLVGHANGDLYGGPEKTRLGKERKVLVAANRRVYIQVAI